MQTKFLPETSFVFFSSVKLVTGSGFLERGIAVYFFNCIFKHQKTRFIWSHYIQDKKNRLATEDVSKTKYIKPHYTPVKKQTNKINKHIRFVD